MVYTLANGKKIRIPDLEIETAMKKHSLTRNESIKLWLEDEGYLTNEEIEAIEKKAKENKITATIHQARTDKAKEKTQKERVKKSNPDKERVIANLAECLKKIDGVETVTIENIRKLITFVIGEKNYKLDLIEKRKPKKEGKA